MTEAAVAPKPTIPSVVRTLASARPTRFRGLIYGATKLGKTTFGAACHAEGGRSLVVPTVRGFEHLAGAPLLIDAAEKPLDLDALGRAIPLAGLKAFDTVVVDDIQGLLAMVQDAVATAFKKDNFDEVNPKQSWPALRQRLFGLLNELARGSRNLLLISREKWVMSKEDDPSRQTVLRILPDLPPSIWASLEGDLDLVGRAFIPPPSAAEKAPRHRLSFNATNIVVAGQRWPAFAEPILLDGAAFWNGFYGGK